MALWRGGSKRGESNGPCRPIGRHAVALKDECSVNVIPIELGEYANNIIVLDASDAFIYA